MRYERDIPFPVKQFANNPTGRDFAVADLHGCLDQFEQELRRVNFDESCDRVFAVGDLCDRGSRSFDSLCLIEKPWFSFVPGNHEAMLLTYLNVRGSDYHRASDFIWNGGDWIEHLTDAQRRHLRDVLVPILVNAPLIIRVMDEDCPFNVLHAEAWAGPERRGQLLTDADLADDDAIAKLATSLTWSRRLVGSAGNGLTENTVVADNGALVVEPAIEPNLSLTYVGHSILEHPVLHRSHLFIDGGAFLREGGNLEASLRLVNHRDTVKSLRAAGVVL